MVQGNLYHKIPEDVSVYYTPPHYTRCPVGSLFAPVKIRILQGNVYNVEMYSLH